MSNKPTNILQDIQKYLPNYLNPEQKDNLTASLKDFPEKMNYYLSSGYGDDALQGDVWLDFTVINFNSLEKKNVKGVVLSNSCDIDLNNARTMPLSVTFVPLITIAKLENILIQSGKDANQVANILHSIRRQESTSFFYLPASGDDFPESVCYLLDIHSQPIKVFQEDCKKRFTLSMPGFYLFILKLAIHFCRMQENIARFESTVS